MFKLKLDPWPQRWLQLATMISAGMSVYQALETLNRNEQKDSLTLNKIAHSVRQGTSLSKALEAQQVLDKFDSALLQSAELAGRLPQGLKYMSDAKSARLQTLNSLIALALFPKVILLISAAAGLFVQIARYSRAPLEAALDIAIIVASTILVIRVLILLLTIDPRVIISLGWNYALLRTKNKRFIQNFELIFYRSLNWQLESGTDVVTALKRNTLLFNPSTY